MLKLNAILLFKTRSRVQSFLLVCALSAVLLATLTSCGDNSRSNVSPTTNTNTNNLALKNSIATGVFNDKDEKFTSILINSMEGSNSQVLFYALQYNNIDPDIFSGTLSELGLVTASSSNLVHQNTSGILRSGIANLSADSNTSFTSTINFSANSVGAKVLTLNPKLLPESTFKFETPALISSIAGNWTGRLSYGKGSSDDYGITITPNGEVSASKLFDLECQLSQASFIPSPSKVNLFIVKAQIPNATQCFLKNERLNGVAYVTTSPIAGKTERIEWIATAADGRGISFRADR
jgi:hypothetical protein